jgi:voltage-gated potassium channel
MEPTSVDPRRDAWERRAEWPLMFTAVAFLIGYAWPILDPDLPTRWRTACESVTWLAWALFVVDYSVRLALAEQRSRFIRRNIFDLAVIALPIFRPLRLLRLVALVRILSRPTSVALRGRVAVYVTGSAALVIFCAAVAVLDAERGSADPNITTFPDALWWAATTVTTVGYGDLYPTTATGRLVATGLMLAGIALLGTVTAALAQWFIEQVRRSDETTQSEIAQLAHEVANLRAELRSLNSPTLTINERKSRG